MTLQERSCQRFESGELHNLEGHGIVKIWGGFPFNRSCYMAFMVYTQQGYGIGVNQGRKIGHTQPRQSQRRWAEKGLGGGLRR